MIRKVLGGAFVIMLALPPAAWALGLGDIRLGSSLNAPISAEIDLIGAAPDELASLKATLATRDTFARYHLEYPSVLNSISVTRGHAADGHDVLVVHSTEAAIEPFLTLLIEVDWSRGRLVREYTVLLDPPVYAANSTVQGPAPVAVPAAARAPRSGAVERPAAATAGASESAPAESAASPAATPAETTSAGAASSPNADTPAETTSSGASRSPNADTYQVRTGDSLSRIVRGITKDPATARRTMVAIYRANTRSFVGNMNVLRAGEVLRIPGEADVAAVSASEALAQVRADQAAWRGRAAPAEGASSGDARLRLVPPSEGTSAPSAAATPGAGTGQRPTGSGSRA